jgi:D-alanyl-D-alanine carboxypeptidase (penicillin-binding protein 5/6)
MSKIKFLGFIVFFTVVTIGNSVWAAPPPITAKTAIVMDAATGKVLFSKNAEERMYPASTTKIMTLIIALERGNLDDIVTASANAANTEGSTLWLAAGEKEKLSDLLYGMMLVSGNDATVAVAEHIAGSVANYAKLMTEKAHAIGAVNTNFVNPNGLPDPNHYTTAHDLARIAAYGYTIPMFREIVSTKHHIMPWPGKGCDRDLYNENRMLWLYKGADGVKTGYTEAAGRVLVSGAERNGIQLITVVMDDEHMWEDSTALMNYGFSQIKPETVFKSGEIYKTIRVTNGKLDHIALVTAKELVLPLGKNDRNEFKTEADVPASVEAPLKKGQKVGTVRVYYKGKDVEDIDLLAGQAVERKSFFAALWSSVWSVFSFFIRNFA